jgi:hypothetical protein
MKYLILNILAFMIVFHVNGQEIVELEPITINYEMDHLGDSSHIHNFELVKIGLVKANDPDTNPDFQIKKYGISWQEPYDIFMISARTGMIYTTGLHIKKFVIGNNIYTYKMKVCAKDPQFHTCATVTINFIHTGIQP